MATTLKVPPPTRTFAINLLNNKCLRREAKPWWRASAESAGVVAMVAAVGHEGGGPAWLPTALSA